jgi:hypothetical protein
MSEMATKKEIHELIGRAVADADFRASLVEEPETAVKDAGFDLTEEQLAALKRVDLKGLGADLDERLSKEVAMGGVGVHPSWT